MYFPAVANVCEGDCSVLVLPSPKSQLQPETLPVDLSLKLKVKGKTPEVLSGEKAAFNGAVDVNPFDE